MTKEIMWGRLIVVGDGYGPNTLKMACRVNDTETSEKVIHIMNTEGVNFSAQNIEDFYDGYLSELSDRVGI